MSVPKGTTIIEAAKQAGILVPHYCYHPSLPSPAVCRMCLVEVEKAPKLMPACVTAVAEGQVVHVESAKAKKAREGVLELLLINHPLDCPICDQAGECELQDYVFQEGRAGYPLRRVRQAIQPGGGLRPRHSVRAQPLHPLHPLRALHGGRGRRAGAQRVRAGRPGLHRHLDRDQRLDHAWSGNVVDLCPVGSLLSKDFLHKARAWDLDKSRQRLPRLHPGLQHHHRYPGRQRGPDPPAARTSRSTATSSATTAG